MRLFTGRVLLVSVLVILGALAQLSAGTVVLQEGVDEYAGCEDTFVSVSPDPFATAGAQTTLELIEEGT